MLKYVLNDFLFEVNFYLNCKQIYSKNYKIEILTYDNICY